MISKHFLVYIYTLKWQFATTLQYSFVILKYTALLLYLFIVLHFKILMGIILFIAENLSTADYIYLHISTWDVISSWNVIPYYIAYHDQAIFTWLDQPLVNPNRTRYFNVWGAFSTSPFRVSSVGKSNIFRTLYISY